MRDDVVQLAGDMATFLGRVGPETGLALADGPLDGFCATLGVDPPCPDQVTQSQVGTRTTNGRTVP